MGEWTAIFATDVIRQALQLSHVIIRDCRVAFYESLNVGNVRNEAVRIEVVGTRGLGREKYGKPVRTFLRVRIGVN